MKRRQFLQAAGWGSLGAIATTLPQVAQAQASSLQIQSFGHSCFRFTGGGLPAIVVNPFKPGGCTAGLALPRQSAGIVLISSRLLDEGYAEAITGNPRVLFEAGVYRLGSLQIQGVKLPHDRIGGRRFGSNVAWGWSQAGLSILHLGGAAAPLSVENQILLGSPDVLLIPVGGSAKSYNPEEAKAAIDILKPRLIIPTQYRTSTASKENCDLGPLQPFLELMQGTPVQRPGTTVTLQKASLPKTGSRIIVL